MNDAIGRNEERETPARSVPRPAPASWPLVFKAGTESISAFFHPAAAGQPRDIALLLCNPVGWEAVAAHRAQRHLAEQLANAGFPVMRFDYPGTGDSSGADADPDRVSGWLAGTSAAMEHLRVLGQRSKLGLIGIHLGATLAVLAAQAAGGVDTLVLWSPYAKGRVFVREAKAYRSLNAPDPKFPAAENDGGLESAGFLLTADTLEALLALDLSRHPGACAKNVLLLEREEKPTTAALVAYFETSATLERTPVPGFLDMMQEPRKSVIPEAAFAAIVDYLSRTHPRAESAPPNPDPAPRAGRRLELRSDGEVSITEEAITFGPNGEFFGILTEPSERRAIRPDRPAILFLTTAAHHRVGPNRMYVPMARALARMGFTSLRFDLTGVGDTPAAKGNVEGNVYAATFVHDVRVAMDHLQRVDGFQRFVTVGLCSGAYLGFHASLADTRIGGVVLINPQTFNWREGDSLDINRRVSFQSTRHYKRAALDPKVWLRALRGGVNLRGIGNAMFERLQKRAKVETARVLRRLGKKDPSGRVDVGDAFGSLLKRGADLLMVYSGSDEGLDYLNAEVGSRMSRLKRSERFTLKIIDGPDHTFTQLWAQDQLVRVVLDHIRTRFDGV